MRWSLLILGYSYHRLHLIYLNKKRGVNAPFFIIDSPPPGPKGPGYFLYIISIQIYFGEPDYYDLIFNLRFQVQAFGCTESENAQGPEGLG